MIFLPIYFKTNDIVVPGDVIAEGNFKIEQGAYRIGRRIISQYLGVVYIKDNKIKVVPLEGSYYPKVGDKVIGKIVDYSIVSWSVDINAPYFARLDASDYLNKPIDPSKVDIRSILDVGDTIYAEIVVADRASNVQLVANKKGLGRLDGGILISITPKKIPRVLGKNRSMINMLKELTKARIIAGNNGYIWIKAPNKFIENIVVEAIRKIERESHVPGLTERIRDFIRDKINELEGERE